MLAWIRSNIGSPESPSPTTCYFIEGFQECAYFHAAVNHAEQLEQYEQARGAPLNTIRVHTQVTPRDEWGSRVDQLRKSIPGATADHTTSPFIYEGCDANMRQFIGGYMAFKKRARPSR
ncbi:hypothetical protein H4R33_005869 [Dimargaris cristalligena]|uniref:Uncharacterized protein n=1 Tax=Dimargaris cristalligena TaxID=215637 RepID=A0A4P9ZWT3_9FUNG|nr:hypothetical protein H4R33_005869 [Dimargaris cristalligena]RKP38114.1 hypothetical protein BJ085DRAFT_30631 [Dimargaris cristalligena]|eukprot:RKP38114.1 hypothetical protein BJ085DRAFT_30631 [Dimargaris cristalligena]